MLYRLLRWITGVALRWFYREIEVTGLERLPRTGPLLIASNHPNALVDALVIGWVLPRPLTLTAKATIFVNPIAAWFLRTVGIVPLRRASDERARVSRGTADRAARNAEAFRAILDRLEDGGAVLIFPEGRSHSEPQIIPLKSGLARLALQARDERELDELCIVPVGLTFERKEEPRTRVHVGIGEPIAIGRWRGDGTSVDALTADVDARLRDVTLNFPSAGDEALVLSLSRLLSSVLDRTRPLSAPERPLAEQLEIARRVEAVRRAIGARHDAVADRAARLVDRIESFEAVLAERGIGRTEVAISTSLARGLWFVLREGAIVGVTGPLALWGRINHWLPLRLARTLAVRTSVHRDESAMRTIVAGLFLVLLAYVLQTALVWGFAGPWWALAYVISLPLTASWDFILRDRLRSARRRTRAYLRFRRDPALRRRLSEEAEWIRREVEWLAASC